MNKLATPAIINPKPVVREFPATKDVIRFKFETLGTGEIKVVYAAFEKKSKFKRYYDEAIPHPKLQSKTTHTPISEVLGKLYVEKCKKTQTRPHLTCYNVCNDIVTERIECFLTELADPLRPGKEIWIKYLTQYSHYYGSIGVLEDIFV